MHTFTGRDSAPTWLVDVPRRLLFYGRDPRGWADLVRYLAERGYPTPTLLQLSLARREKGQARL